MIVRSIIDEKGRAVTTSVPGATLAEIAATLAEQRIGAVVITDSDAISGILSERDIVRALASDGAGALDRSARDYMTRSVATCALHDSIHSVMQKMTSGRFRHLPVVEGGQLVGIVSIGDVVKRRLEELQREADEIRDFISTA